MDPNLLAFITTICNRGFSGNGRINFLLALRDKPDVVVKWVEGKLLLWFVRYNALSAVACEIELADSSRIIVEHFTQHFAEEIHVLPPAVAAAVTPQSV